MKKQKFYTKKEVADIMGVAWITVHRWVLSGKIKTVVIAGKTRIPETELHLSNLGD